MFAAFFKSTKWAFWAYGVGAVLLVGIYIQVQMLVWLNAWYKKFYDLLQKPEGHDISEFWANIIEFIWIAVPYIILATIISYITSIYAFRWREAITFDYIPRWRNVETEIEGASQRIQEDTYRFAKIIESLGLQFFRAIMVVFAFLPILWGLSSQVDLPIIRDIPGSLVWAALLVSVGGMLISWVVGIKLPGLEYNNQKVEAAYRKELVYGEDDKKNYSSQETIFELFTGLRVNYHRLFLHYTYFNLWANFYGQFSSILPLVIVGPGMFTGAVTLGVVIQVNQAFDKVHTSFSLLIENWTTITELRSIHKRLKEFEDNLDRYQVEGTAPSDAPITPDTSSEL